MSLASYYSKQVLVQNLTPEERAALEAMTPAQQNDFLLGKAGTVTPPIIDKMQLFYLVALIKLSKTPEGLKVINNLGGKLIDGIFTAQGKLNQVSAGNDITAWGAPVLQSALFERLGLLAPGFNSQFHMGLSMIAGGEFVEDLVTAITGMFNFKRTTKSDNVQSISTGLSSGVGVAK